MNKKQLFDMLLSVWSSDEVASKYEGEKFVVLVVNGVAHKLTSESGVVKNTEIHSLRSNQEESGTRFILYLRYAQDQNFDCGVIRSADSDVFFILLHYAKDFTIPIYLDTFRKLIDISGLSKSLSPYYSTVLMGLYCYTGEDCSSAFKGKGKVRPLQKLEKNPRFQEVFAKLGSDWDIDEYIMNEVEQFTCLMYGYPRLSSIDEVRYLKLKEMVGDEEKLTSKSKVDLSKLPPCMSSLQMHVERVNYRLAQWKHSHIPIYEMPDPLEHGWEYDDKLEPKWSNGPILPQKLIDIVPGSEPNEAESDSDDDGSEEEVSDIEDIVYSDADSEVE